MIEQSLLLKLSTPKLADNTISRLRQEYQAYQRLFQAQTAIEQQHLNSQAAALADAIQRGMPQAHFTLPDQVITLTTPDQSGIFEMLPAKSREQKVGSRLDLLKHTTLPQTLDQKLSELEKSTSQAVSVGAGLMRYAVAMYMIYHLLPAGESVVYTALDGDDIPNQPIRKRFETGSGVKSEVPDTYVNAAQGFFMPQWIAFDDQNHLVARDLQAATDSIVAMQRYLLMVNDAVRLAPYMVVDEEYQNKQYGILGQLVNQGRALAHYKVVEICEAIKRRSALHKLDRGFSLDLPYFNDETLMMESYSFDVIPNGRVMFVPAFVVLAVRAQGPKVLQDTRLNHTTRRNLLKELIIIEKVFLR